MRCLLVYKSVVENSHKFWFAEVVGTTVVRRWGRVGTKGQSKTFEHGSPEEALEATKKVAEAKRRKGYQDVPVDDVDLIVDEPDW